MRMLLDILLELNFTYSSLNQEIDEILLGPALYEEIINNTSEKNYQSNISNTIEIYNGIKIKKLTEEEFFNIDSKNIGEKIYSNNSQLDTKTMSIYTDLTPLQSKFMRDNYYQYMYYFKIKVK